MPHKRLAYSLIGTLLALSCTLSGAAAAPSPTATPAALSPSATAPALIPTRTPALPSTPAPARGTRRAPRPNSVDNGNILVHFTVASGLALADICDEATDVDYVSPDCSGTQSMPLFAFGAGSGASAVMYPSDSGLTIKAARPNPDGSLSLTAVAKDLPLSFSLDVSAPDGGPAAVVRLKVKNTGPQAVDLRLTLPKLDGLQNVGSPDMWAAVPQEIGSVGPLNDPQSFASQGLFGMKIDPRLGVPHALSALNVAAIYNHRSGGGLFVASLDDPAMGGVAPIEFNVDAKEVAGYWSAPVDAGKEVSLPGLAIGVLPSGDWHAAVDYYISQNKANWTFPSIPAWFRDEGAIYSVSGGGAGSIYLELPVRASLKGVPDIRSFEDLPLYLTEAEALGSHIIYLDNYWEGAANSGQSAYANKGDYIPRSDLGGAAALKDGIAKVHQQGGRVILYVEPFIISQYSHIGNLNGPQWEGHDALGDFDRWYPTNYKMVAPFGPWQDYLVGVAQRLVRDYGADGIFLDSYSYQLNWQVRVGGGDQYYSPQAYNLGVLQLTQRIRTAIQTVKPDAVVLGETTSGPIARVWDGGLSADFSRQWGPHRAPTTKLVAAPVRYGLPQVNFMSNGLNINELHQIFAAGENLALCCNWPGTFMNQHASEIRSLVGIRRQYKDALIYGEQAYQPQTDDVNLAAYFYAGTDHQIITVVNTSDAAYAGALTLRTSEANTAWQDLVGGSSSTANGTSLPVRLAAQGILVLLKQK
jgi:hypothetical protein